MSGHRLDRSRHQRRSRPQQAAESSGLHVRPRGRAGRRQRRLGEPGERGAGAGRLDHHQGQDGPPRGGGRERDRRSRGYDGRQGHAVRNRLERRREGSSRARGAGREGRAGGARSAAGRREAPPGSGGRSPTRRSPQPSRSGSTRIPRLRDSKIKVKSVNRGVVLLDGNARDAERAPARARGGARHARREARRQRDREPGHPGRRRDLARREERSQEVGRRRRRRTRGSPPTRRSG